MKPANNTRRSLKATRVIYGYLTVNVLIAGLAGHHPCGHVAASEATWFAALLVTVWPVILATLVLRAKAHRTPLLLAAAATVVIFAVFGAQTAAGLWTGDEVCGRPMSLVQWAVLTTLTLWPAVIGLMILFKDRRPVAIREDHEI